jgi:hypothetical protein
MQLRATRLTAIANAVRNRFSGAALDLRFSGGTSLDPRITFSRTTNATVTGSNGLIQNAPMNLLTFSEQFDNAAWTKTGTTVTANSAVGPNGTITADKLVATAAAGAHGLSSPMAITQATVYTSSCFAKQGEYRYAALTLSTSGFAIAYFDLQTGVVTSISGSTNPTANIVDVGDGWYRISITAPAGTAGAGGIFAISAPNTLLFTGDGTSGIFIWGAQLELGSTATTYNPTTVKNLLGFTENFDNAAWAKINAFVQTNLLPYSEELDTGWTNGTGATWQYSSGVSPIGTTTALGVDGLAGIALINTSPTLYRGSIAISGSTAYTFSVYVRSKAGTADVALRMAEGGGNNTVSSGNIVTTEWTRLSMSVTSAAGATSLTVAVGTGSGTADLFIWGAQLVQGTTPGDYKATYAAAAPVGYTDIYGQPFAQKLVENTTATVQHRFDVTPVSSAVPQTFSVYAKAAERNFMGLRIGGAGTSFDLSNGTFGNVAVGSTASMTDVGNGWYRCSVTVAAPTANDICRINLATVLSTAQTYTGDGTSGIYIFGAQLSDSASVDPYVYQPVAAPASTAYYGPRFNYDPVTLAPKGLLIEEQRTNLILQSETFDNASWTKVNAAVTANATASPDGTVDADKVITGAGVSDGQLRQSVTKAAAATQYTYSIYAKAGEWNSAGVYMVGPTGGFANRANVIVNLLTGVVTTAAAAAGTFTGASATVTPVGNGWYRIALTATTGTETTVEARAYPSNNGTFPNGNGTDGIFLYGAQLEAGALATSYIPTVASQVTRAADSASMIGNNFARWYTQGSGTMLASFDFSGAGSSANPNIRTAFNISDGTSNNRLQIYNISGNVGSFIAAGGASQAALDTFSPVPVDVFRTVSLAYASNDAIQAVNGSLSSNDTSVIVPVVNAAYIGSEPASARLNGHLRRITYYPRRLANTELQGITS